MADLGNTSQADTAHKHKASSWTTVAVIVVASVVLAFALIAQSVVLGVVGGVLLIGGVALGVTYGIMDDAH